MYPVFTELRNSENTHISGFVLKCIMVYTNFLLDLDYDTYSKKYTYINTSSINDFLNLYIFALIFTEHIPLEHLLERSILKSIFILFN